MDYTKEELDKLRKLSYELKIDVIKMLDKADSGHIGGAFSIADIVTCLYFSVANLDPQNPDWEERDYILLSNGHVCPILYSALARKGYFPKEELNNLRKIDSLLQGHPKLGIPGVENTSGLLGQGLSQGVGIALGLTMDSKNNKVYVITSDGEHQEGQTWEAIMSANKWSLNNLVVIVDRNHVQIDGNTEDIMPLGNLKEKYESFGWIALDINGHDYNEILQTFEFVKKVDQPVAIIAHTISGEDISFMERLYKYHDWKDDPAEVEMALKELQAELDKFN
ncbi:transketolase [Candidatus Dojkabacteria bacterium]|jgi:transketolase|uniref:Transketolase n=1 Tax=Candidatus Dojkabacteria bacterium TaxID=2099670 RepID=A0A955I8G0_9BACT|nr:transketolase [Candidatus Dojkabacteria bacterium]